jgi:uncharacterized protein
MPSVLRLAAAACLMCTATGAMAQGDILPPVPVTQPAATDIDPALWVLKDADTTIYLFGTVHILKPGMGWFDDGVKTAFDASDMLVLEMVEPPRGEAMGIMADLSIDKGGKGLRSKIDPAEVAAYEAALKKLGLPPEAFDPLDPWAAAINIYYAGLIKAGYDLTSGVEPQLTAAAKATSKPIKGLETMRGQLSIFDELPAKTQLRYVSDTVNSLDEIPAQTDRLVALWAAADTDAVAAIMNEGFDSLQLTELLLTRRNANWARWINHQMAKPGTVFVAVGTGHLAGPASVQNLLLAYDKRAERVLY